MSPYGVLLRLYPRAFREEYGEDMAHLLRNQLRDERAIRVWARTLLDVALTVPTLRLEAHMSRAPSAWIIYTTATVASLVLAIVVGTSVGISVLGLAGVFLFGSLAFISWRRARALGSSGHAAHWWKYLISGAVSLTAVVIAANVGGEVDAEGTWAVFMIVLLTSICLIATGVVLGITHAVQRRGRGAPATGSS